MKLARFLALIAIFWAPFPASTGAAETVAELPGVALAKGITEMTGVAISPLLGLSAMGAWHYFKTADSLRDQLPWFCHPAAWGTGLGLLILCFLKDLTGPATPALIKKPLDAAELFENKISALVACAAFVPFVVAQFSAGLPELPPGASVWADGAVLGMVPVSAAKWIGLPLSLVGFGVVWVVSHSVQVLILLSPFGLIDTVLKTMRMALLGAVALISAINPIVGAFFCLIIVAAAALLAPWAFRLSVFGSVMAGDALVSLVRRSPEPEERLAGFLTHGRKPGFPARIFGHVTAGADGRLRFVSRRLFIGPARILPMDDVKSAVLHRGLVFPSISGTGDRGRPVKPFVALLPRYRPHLETMARRWQLGGIRDVLLVRGLKGAVAWIREAFSGGRAISDQTG